MVGQKYILCPNCEYKTPSGYLLCKHCGNPLPGEAQPPPLLILTGHGRSYPLVQGTIRIGRMTDNELIIADALVSRHHAVIHRDETGRHLVEDLHSLNGTYLNGVRLAVPTRIKAGDVLLIGRTTLYLTEVPRRADELQPEKTIISPLRQQELPATPVEVESIMPGAWRDASFRPKAREGWALKHLTDDDGHEYFILKSFDRAVYLRLTERDVFLWKLMEGTHSLRDMLLAYLQEYQALGTDRLYDLMDELASKGFLENVEPARPPAPRGIFGRGLASARAAFHAFLQKEFPVQGADELITRVYEQVGWRIYTTPGQLALAAVALAGAVAFVLILMRGGQSLFEVQGSLALGLLVLGLANTVSIFLHEMGHALTVKAYNRQVRRVGFMVHFGLPIFFVDTSDIWMEPQGPRIQASLAGPYTSFLVGSATSLVILAMPDPLLTELLFKLAAWSYIDAFFNLNPLLELDGYYILMDVLEMPLLRKRSLNFVRRSLWQKLWRREVFTREEKLFAVFGVLSALWSLVTIGIVVLIWHDHIVGLARGEPGDLVTVITLILLGAVLVMVALWAQRRRTKKIVSW